MFFKLVNKTVEKKMYITQKENAELSWACKSAVENSHCFSWLFLSFGGAKLLLATLLLSSCIIVNFADFLPFNWKEILVVCFYFMLLLPKWNRPVRDTFLDLLSNLFSVIFFENFLHAKQLKKTIKEQRVKRQRKTKNIIFNSKKDFVRGHSFMTSTKYV